MSKGSARKELVLASAALDHEISLASVPALATDIELALNPDALGFAAECIRSSPSPTNVTRLAALLEHTSIGAPHSAPGGLSALRVPLSG